jgi:sugar (pentulose or hexulose) kinase
VGTGWYRTFKEAADQMSRIRKTIRPEMQKHRRYQRFFAVYKRIYPSLKKLESHNP